MLNLTQLYCMVGQQNEAVGVIGKLRGNRQCFVGGPPNMETL